PDPTCQEVGFRRVPPTPRSAFSATWSFAVCCSSAADTTPSLACGGLFFVPTQRFLIPAAISGPLNSGAFFRAISAYICITPHRQSNIDQRHKGRGIFVA